MVVCDLAMALPSKTAMAAINKRKLNDFMGDSLMVTPGILRDSRDGAYTDRNTDRGEKAVKRRSTGVKFCQKGYGGRRV